ncbi:hypothetical protein ACLIA0_07170 [Bacillaceae bacterium W0354]
MKQSKKRLLVFCLVIMLVGFGFVNAEKITAATKSIGSHNSVFVYGQLEFRTYSGLHAQAKTYTIEEKIIERLYVSVGIYEDGNQISYNRSSIDYDWYDSGWAYTPSVTEYGGREYSALSYHSATINGQRVTGSMKIIKNS